MAHAARVPQAVESYFGSTCSHPIITLEFKPDKGWQRTNYRKRVSRSWARKLQAEGVTWVGLSSDGRTADFRIEELTR